MPEARLPLPIADCSPEQVAQARRWVATWQRAGEQLQRIRVRELRELDGNRAISLLLSSGAPSVAPRPSSGLVEQQRWFMRMPRHS